jgi:hypothetical protein
MSVEVRVDYYDGEEMRYETLHLSLLDLQLLINNVNDSTEGSLSVECFFEPLLSYPCSCIEKVWLS